MLKDLLTQDFKQAMKTGDTIKKNTIQMMRAAIMQAEKDNVNGITEEEMENILVKEKKKRLDALAQFEKASRADLIQQTQKEISCIESYLPEPILQEDLEKIIQDIIEETNAEMKNMSQVIRSVKEKVGNRADGRTISKIVKEKLEEKLNG